MKFQSVTIPDHRKPLARKALRFSSYYLGLDRDPPGIRFFTPMDTEVEDTKQIRFRRDPKEGPAELRGVCQEFDHDVWVRADLTDQELVLTIAHELYHRKEFLLSRRDGDEQGAENFAHFILRKITHKQRRPVW